MANITDISQAVESALTEIGVTGALTVHLDDDETGTSMGSPSGDDVEVTINVTALHAADDQDSQAKRSVN